MIYLSKGIAREGSTRQNLVVLYCGQEYELTGIQAVLWQDGRFGFAALEDPRKKPLLEQLARMGLAETEPEDTPAARYRILTRCFCCPAESEPLQPPMLKAERDILCWLRCAGLRLTAAELIFLREHGIEPVSELLGEDHRQALVEAIYTQDNIGDGLLEQQMEMAACRDETVGLLQQLLRQRKILIL